MWRYEINWTHPARSHPNTIDDLQWPFGVLGMLTVLLVIMSSNEVLQSVAWRCKSKSMVSCQHGWNVSGVSLFPSCFLCILQLLHFLPKAFRNRLNHPSRMAAARESGYLVGFEMQFSQFIRFRPLEDCTHLGKLGKSAWATGQLWDAEGRGKCESRGGGWGGYWLGSTHSGVI